MYLADAMSNAQTLGNSLKPPIRQDMVISPNLTWKSGIFLVSMKQYLFLLMFLLIEITF